MSKFTFLILLFVSKVTYAKSHVELTPIISSSDIVKLFISLLSVIVLVLLFSYLFRKLNSIHIGKQGMINIDSAIQVGVKERVVVIDVADKKLLVGVTSGSISLLAELDPEKIEKPNSTSFLESLNTYIKKGS